MKRQREEGAKLYETNAASLESSLERPITQVQEKTVYVKDLQLKNLEREVFEFRK